MEIQQNSIQKESLFSIRSYTLGDEIKILSLFQKVFHRTKTLSQWKWQFSDNPYSPPQVSVVEEADAIIGNYAVVPVQWNVMGRPYLSCQTVDIMVHSTKRLQNVFERMADHSFSNLIDKGFCATFGFPNRNSYPGFVRKLGWSRVCYMKEYFRRLSIKSFLTKAFSLPILVGIFDFLFTRVHLLRVSTLKQFYGVKNPKTTVHTSSSIPEGFDSFWKSIAHFEVLSLWKDTRYLSWRYDKNPRFRFTYFYTLENGTITSLCVVNFQSGHAQILELFVQNHNTAIARQLLVAVEHRALKNKSERVIFTASDLNFFDETFKHYRKQTNFDHVFCLRVFGNAQLRELANTSNNWTITQGDSDVFY